VGGGGGAREDGRDGRSGLLTSRASPFRRGCVMIYVFLCEMQNDHNSVRSVASQGNAESVSPDGLCRLQRSMLTFQLGIWHSTKTWVYP